MESASLRPELQQHQQIRETTNNKKMGEESSEMDMKSQMEFLWGNLTASVERNAEISKEIDKFFLIVMAVVIFFMQCGFAFLEAGSVRYTNLSLSWWMDGWGLANFPSIKTILRNFILLGGILALKGDSRSICFSHFSV